MDEALRLAGFLCCDAAGRKIRASDQAPYFAPGSPSWARHKAGTGNASELICGSKLASIFPLPQHCKAAFLSPRS
jgi:hypothetical protein